RLPSTADVVEREALRREVVDAVLGLDEPYRTTLLLRFFEDEPASSIAKRLSIPVETVRTRIKRGLDRVRERLDADHDGDRRAWILALVPLAKPTPAASLVLTGAIVMKLAMKLLVAVVIVLAIVFAWRSFAPTRDAETARVTPTSMPEVPAKSSLATQSVVGTPAAPRDDVPAKPHVSGIVVDRTGHPIASASVNVYACTVSQPVALGGASSVRTDDHGRFTIPLPGSAPFFSLVADAPGFSPERIAAVHASDDVTVTLDPARSLTGTVTDIDAEPIAGATVRWTSLLAASRIDRVAVSKADGTYRIEGLPSLGSRLRNGETSNIALVEVRASGFAPLLHRPTFGLQLTSDDVHLDFVLLTGATLTGRVVDGETNEPMGGARVVVWADGDAVITQSPDALCIEAPSTTLLGETSSAADGSFTFEHLPAKGLNEPPELRLANLQLAVGWVSAVKSGWAPGTEGVALAKDGESLDVTIHCWPKATISGRVVDQAGSPIVDAYVLPAFKEPKTGWFPDVVRDVPARRVRTDERGRYTLDAVAAMRAGSQVGVTAEREGFWGQPWRRFCVIDVGVRAGESAVAPDIVIAAEPSAIIEVRDSTDRPVSGAKITADDVPYPLGRTDERGRAQVYFASDDPRCRGPQRVLVHAPGFAVGASDEFRPSAESPREVRVTLRPEHRLSGKIMFDDGSEAAGVELEISNAMVDPRDAVSHTRG
ncbi:MAG: carboxypeptidase regulatory-like domain-containing protein, partial [Planctomycetes bacterium]|nr:carboxypeptidase regulatory-like domain-containing protein [Planctomycetota bacterium]